MPLAVVVEENVPHPVVHKVPFCRSVQFAWEGEAGSLPVVAVNCTEPLFTGISAEAGETEMVMARTVTVVLFDFVESDIAVAVIVTAKFATGGVEGAVYVTVVLVGLLRVPTAGVGEVMAQEVGLTPALAGSNITVAVIVEVPLGQGRDRQNCTELGFAERETAMAAKVITVDPGVAGGLVEVAVIVTCTSLGGGLAGAV